MPHHSLYILIYIISSVLICDKYTSASLLLSGPDKTLVKLLTTIKSNESCHPHFVIDDEHGPYIPEFIKTQPTPITIYHVHSTHYKLLEETVKGINTFNNLSSLPSNTPSPQTFENLSNYNLSKVANIKLHNNFYECPYSF